MRLPILGLAIIFAQAVSAQGLDLPRPAFDGAAWGLLDQVGLSEAQAANGDWIVTKKFPPELKAAAEVPFRISGYVVPVTAEAKQQHILLVRDPEDCPFCGSNASYAPALEVTLRKPVSDITEFDHLTVRGRLELIEDTDTFQSVILKDAEIVVGK